MGWLEGLLTGYSDRLGDIRRENAQEAERSAQREGRVYEALLNSPDEEIRGMAATGLLSSTQPRRGKGGFAGWMGEMQGNPMYPTLMKYISTPKTTTTETTEPGLPSRQTQGYLPTLPGQKPSLAQPSTSPTEGEGMATPQPLPGAMSAPPPPPGASDEFTGPEQPPPPIPESWQSLPTPPPPPDWMPHAPGAPGSAMPLPTPGLTTRDVAGPTLTHRTSTTALPRVFPTTEDTETTTARAKGTGEFQSLADVGRRSGQPNPEKWAADLIAAEHMRRASGGMPYQSLEIEWTGADGQTHRELGSFDKSTNRYFGSQGTPILGTVTKAVPYSAMGMGQSVNQAMAEYGVTPDDVRSNPGIASLVIQRAHELDQEAAGARTTGTREARAPMLPAEALSQARQLLPNATLEQQTALADALMKASRPAGTPGVAPPATAPPATVTPPVQKPVTPAAAPTAAAGPIKAVQQADGSWALDMPAATPATAPAAAPGAAPATTPAAGGFGAQVISNLPPGGGAQSKETGKPFPPALASTVAQTEATNRLIDNALKALEPFKNDNTPEGAINLARKYRQGVYDPVASAAAQLGDLAGLQAKNSQALSAGGTRAWQFVVQKSQHVPRLPSSRQIQFRDLHVPTSVIGATSRLIKDDEGGWDTPQMMYHKLEQVRVNNVAFLKELETLRVMQPGVVGTPPPRP